MSPHLAAVAPDFVSLHTAVKYVAGAYIVVLAVILVYVAIMAVRLTRNARELQELRRLVDEREAEGAITGSHAGDGESAALVREAQAEAIRQEHQL